MHTTVQHRRAANTLASIPFARPEPLPSHRRPARHNPARSPHPSSASLRCELRGARTAGESLDLLGQVASRAAAWSTKGDKVRLLELKGEDDGYKAQAHGRFDHRGQFAPFRRLRRRCGRLDRLQVGQVVVGLGQDVEVLVKAFLLRARSPRGFKIC